MAYTGETLDVDMTLRQLGQQAVAQGFTVEERPLPGDWPLIALHRKATLPKAPRVLISTGLHGDEPAGPLAVLRLLESAALPAAINWVLFPMICPGNLAANRRECTDGSDPNRDYRNPRTAEVQAQLAWLAEHGGAAFDASFLLHEDWESPGFYMYEQGLPEAHSLAKPMMKTAEAHCGLNRAPVIEGLPSRGGLISFRGREPDLLDWPESVYLMKQGSKRSHTLETPSGEPLEKRVACHAAVVQAGLEALLRG